MKLDPKCAEAFFGVGWIYVKEEDYGVARQELEEAVRLAPDYAEARYQLARIYLFYGELREAGREYAALKKLDPGLAEKLKAAIDSVQ